jgi:hypothetical protein
VNSPPRPPAPGTERLRARRLTMADALRIEKLRADHAFSGFDCGQEELNRFLSRFALANLRAGAAQTYKVSVRAC